MRAYFWLGTDLGVFLFEGNRITGVWGFLVTCVILAALSILNEWLKIANARLRNKTAKSALERVENMILAARETDCLIKTPKFMPKG